MRQRADDRPLCGVHFLYRRLRAQRNRWRQLEAHRGIGLRTSFDLLDMWDGGFAGILRDRRTWDGSARGLLCRKDGIEGKRPAAQATAKPAT